MNDGKKCPYCSAPIQENAAFCLHCMKSLDQKSVIEKPKRKNTLLIIICVGILLISAGLIFYFFCPAARKHFTAESSRKYTDSHTTDSEKESETASQNQNSDQSRSTSAGISKSGSSSKSNSLSGESGKSDASSSKVSSSKADKQESGAHTHSYTAKVTKAATCTTEGEKKYTCSCGDIYTEKIPPTGNHSWVAITKTVHHNEEGHYENIKTSDAYTWYKCPQCSAIFYSLGEYYTHFDSVHVPSDPFISYIRDSFVHGTVPENYEQVWVIDKPAYDEKITTGYKCSVCGKIK